MKTGLALALGALTACSGAASDAPSGSGSAAATLAEVRALPLRCQGNEPFWNLRLRATDAEYRALVDEGRVRHFEGRAVPLGGEAESAFEWSGLERDATQRLVAVLRAGTCLDTMSDESFPHSIELSVAGEGLRGCCRRGDGPSAMAG